MPVADLYRQLGVPQSGHAWEWSGRNEAANIVAFQVDTINLRDATPTEKERGIAMVHESVTGHGDTWYRIRDVPTIRGTEAFFRWEYMLDDLEFAHDQASCVRAIVFNGNSKPGEWQILPNRGKVVEIDQRAGTYKIVFFEP